MICGYVASTQQPTVENILCKVNPQAEVFIYKRRKFIGWFLASKKDKVIYENNQLLLIDGLPVLKISPYDYDVWDKNEDYIKKQIKVKRFLDLLEQIVSNVNSIFFDANEGKLLLASNRAAAGRIYYKRIQEGLVFSNNFLCLMKMGEIDLNWDAVYAIIKYGAPPDPLTISKDIFSIPVGHYGICSIPKFNISIQPYFQFDFPQKHNGNLEAVKKYLLGSAKLLGSLKASILLSGGVDSTLYAHLLCENADDEIRAFYLCFGENDPEITFAEKAAAESGCSLEIIEMQENDVVDSISEMVEMYSHPFSDYSTIPTYYLLRQIWNKVESGILVEGTGGDACFGFSTLLNANRWIRVFNAPFFIKALARKLYSTPGFWDANVFFVRYLAAFAACCEPYMTLSPLVLCPADNVFNESYVSKTDITGHYLRLFSNLIKKEEHNLSFHAMATVADIAHTCSKLYTAKTYGLFSSKIQVVYPYLWRDILIEQGNISWTIKIRNGIVKWPLKSLLEKYMSKEFVYRKKSAFLPPLERWLRDESVYKFFRETLVDQEIIVGRVVSQEKSAKLVNRLSKSRNISPSLCHFLWGTLFTELWLRRNLKNATNISQQERNYFAF
ncbi:MAG: asparagine synthase C-terminal domain-containing protein [Candidatus Bathyarchaeia archaeon]